MKTRRSQAAVKRESSRPSQTGESQRPPNYGLSFLDNQEAERANQIPDDYVEAYRADMAKMETYASEAEASGIAKLIGNKTGTEIGFDICKVKTDSVHWPKNLWTTDINKGGSEKVLHIRGNHYVLLDPVGLDRVGDDTNVYCLEEDGGRTYYKKSSHETRTDGSCLYDAVWMVKERIEGKSVTPAPDDWIQGMRTMVSKGMQKQYIEIQLTSLFADLRAADKDRQRAVLTKFGRNVRELLEAEGGPPREAPSSFTSHVSSQEPVSIAKDAPQDAPAKPKWRRRRRGDRETEEWIKQHFPKEAASKPYKHIKRIEAPLHRFREDGGALWTWELQDALEEHAKGTAEFSKALQGAGSATELPSEIAAEFQRLDRIERLMHATANPWQLTWLVGPEREALDFEISRTVVDRLIAVHAMDKSWENADSSALINEFESYWGPSETTTPTNTLTFAGVVGSIPVAGEDERFRSWGKGVAELELADKTGIHIDFVISDTLGPIAQFYLAYKDLEQAKQENDQQAYADATLELAKNAAIITKTLAGYVEKGLTLAEMIEKTKALENAVAGAGAFAGGAGVAVNLFWAFLHGRNAHGARMLRKALKDTKKQEAFRQATDIHLTDARKLGMKKARRKAIKKSIASTGSLLGAGASAAGIAVAAGALAATPVGWALGAAAALTGVGLVGYAVGRKGWKNIRRMRRASDLVNMIGAHVENRDESLDPSNYHTMLAELDLLPSWAEAMVANRKFRALEDAIYHSIKLKRRRMALVIAKLLKQGDREGDSKKDYEAAVILVKAMEIKNWESLDAASLVGKIESKLTS